MRGNNAGYLEPSGKLLARTDTRRDFLAEMLSHGLRKEPPVGRLGGDSRGRVSRPRSRLFCLRPYKPLRIDKTEHVNKICDEIIAQIRRSRFLVVDYTGHRAGVYYEAGYAAGRDIPVILTCRKEEIEKLHFDVRQLNGIDWQTPAELAARLQAR